MSAEGEPLPEPPKLTESNESDEVAAALHTCSGWWGGAEGLLMESKAIHSHARGFWNPSRRQFVIRLDEAIDDDGKSFLATDPLSAMKTKTLAHELAHYVGEHSNHTERDDAEVIAESAAFVTLNHFGLETATYSFGYVAGWAGNIERVRKNLAEVQRVANVLISAAEGNKPLRESDDRPVVTAENERLRF